MTKLTTLIVGGAKWKRYVDERNPTDSIAFQMAHNPPNLGASLNVLVERQAFSLLGAAITSADTEAIRTLVTKYKVNPSAKCGLTYGSESIMHYPLLAAIFQEPYGINNLSLGQFADAQEL